MPKNVHDLNTVPDLDTMLKTTTSSAGYKKKNTELTWYPDSTVRHPPFHSPFWNSQSLTNFFSLACEKVFPRPNIKKRFSWTFLMEFLDMMYEQFMGDFTFRDLASRQVQLFLSSVNFTRDHPSPSHIFSLTAVFRLSFLILNTCYEHTTLVWVFQLSYLNVHWTNFVLRCS